MTAVLAQRQLSLVAVAMVGVVVALVVAARDEQATKIVPVGPRPAVSDVSGWYAARAGVRTRPLAGHASGCGTLLSPKTLGVGHSVLPCGAKIFIALNGKTVLTTVVDRGPFAPDRDFEVTPALAEVFGLEGKGTQPIRWSFARAA
jgi:hypothetical protein